MTSAKGENSDYEGNNMDRIKASAAVFGMSALLVITLACGGGDDGGPVVVTDYASLLDSLISTGAEVGFSGFTAPTYFTEARARLLKVNDEGVLVFQFGDFEGADAADNTVSADGGSIGATTMGWDAPPHFYKGGTLIVLYIGSSSLVINILQEALGSQFAGQ